MSKEAIGAADSDDDAESEAATDDAESEAAADGGVPDLLSEDVLLSSPE